MLAALLATVAPTVAAEGPRLLPAVTLHLEAARYEPVETDLHWVGWLGGGADVLRAGGVSAYFSGDVETIIGNTRRAFDATQVNYHLETGLRRSFGRAVVNPFFHHVSRHYSDREKPEAVDWNVLGLRASARWPEARIPLHLAGSIGHTTLASVVGYRWEITGSADALLAGGNEAGLFAAAAARFVTIDPDPRLVRGDFLDFRAEAGARFTRGPRVLETWAAFERRNDVFLEVPGARRRALFGFRIRLADPE